MPEFILPEPCAFGCDNNDPPFCHCVTCGNTKVYLSSETGECKKCLGPGKCRYCRGDERAYACECV